MALPLFGVEMWKLLALDRDDFYFEQGSWGYQSSDLNGRTGGFVGLVLGAEVLAELAVHCGELQLANLGVDGHEDGCLHNVLHIEALLLK